MGARIARRRLNFLFVSGIYRVDESYDHAKGFKVQASTNPAFGVSAAASLLAGTLINASGAGIRRRPADEARDRHVARADPLFAPRNKSTTGARHHSLTCAV
jgi:hypothetical protein